jgi:hypothetical protein
MEMRDELHSLVGLVPTEYEGRWAPESEHLEEKNLMTLLGFKPQTVQPKFAILAASTSTFKT